MPSNKPGSAGTQTAASIAHPLSKPAWLRATVYRELIDFLLGGATVITANRRLAAAIRSAFDLEQSCNGRPAWPAADVLPWSAWLSRIFRDALFRGATQHLPASPAQEQFLWRRVLEQSNDVDAVLSVSATAESAHDAWRLAHGWRLLPALNKMPLAPEGEAFLRWARAYEAACSRNRLLDSARLPDIVHDLIRAGRVGVPARLILFGFDALDPQQQDLIDTLESSSTTVTVMEAARVRCSPQVVREHGIEQEIRAVASWTRARLEANPQARIGVVVPELARLRAIVLRVLDEVLVPSSLLEPGDTALRPWNVSLGTALADWPLVYAALSVLELASRELSFERVSVVLRSPFIGGAGAEGAARALLDARLRRLGDPHWSLKTLEYHASQAGNPQACPALAQALARLQAAVQALPSGPQSVSFWGPALQSLLSTMRWPGDGTLSSHEYQTFTAWKDMLAQLPQLDVVSGPVSLRTAIDIVFQLARERIFQPETPAVPIQVLGPLEAAQLEFDHLWVLGLTDEAWPRAARPNPLLPIELQRSRGVTRGCAQWELRFAQRLQAGWEAAAPEVVFSWHDREGDRELSQSPLLGGLRATTLEELGISRTPEWRTQVFREARTDEFVDWTTTQLPPGMSFSGGARLLQDQAACAFRAFVAHRLRAKALEHPQEGLSARDRGVVMHAAAATLWSELKSSERLRDIDVDELRGLIDRSVVTALARLRPRRTSLSQLEFMELERDRLCALLHDWLDVERARAPFEVLANEEDRSASVGGLELRLRLDRVDRLATHGEMLIDYKSGESTVAAWFGERPDEPQLPLYAITRTHAPRALAFAHVARGQCAFVGLAADAHVAPGVQQFDPSKSFATEDWEQLIDNWRSTLERLALAFRSGRVPVDPKKRIETCSRCEYGLVCRVSELTGRDVAVATPTSADD